ncbi:MAG: zinc-ribbon domain-containing protein [Thaumarchaeota archaeon]|nr:zinc-ribbon domain-containing protein [Nitrososphaerota archaeon]
MSEEGDYKLCPRCNTKVPAYMKFCPNCGLRLDDSTLIKKQETKKVQESIVQETKVFEQKQEVKPPTTFKEKSNEWPSKCPNCGFEIKEGEKYCPNCGFNIEVWLMRKKRGEKQTTVAYYTTPKKFFSFEGYSLEGVTPAAVMYLVWAFWNLLMAILVKLGQTKLFLPPPLSYDNPSLQIVFLVFIGVALILAAFGLMQVNSILYLLGIVVLAVSIPIGLLQLSYSLNVNPSQFTSPTGTHQMENLLMGFLAVMISTIGLIQTLRIRKYFFGE